MSYTTPFAMVRDINGFNSFGLPIANVKYSALLLNLAEDHFTVPSDAKNYAVVFAFQPGSSIWVAYDVQAQPPTSSFGATFSELNPAVRFIPAGTIISFITNDTTAEVGVLLYAIN